MAFRLLDGVLKVEIGAFTVMKVLRKLSAQLANDFAPWLRLQYWLIILTIVFLSIGLKMPQLDRGLVSQDPSLPKRSQVSCFSNSLGSITSTHYLLVARVVKCEAKVEFPVPLSLLTHVFCHSRGVG